MAALMARIFVFCAMSPTTPIFSSISFIELAVRSNSLSTCFTSLSTCELTSAPSRALSRFCMMLAVISSIEADISSAEAAWVEALELMLPACALKCSLASTIFSPTWVVKATLVRMLSTIFSRLMASIPSSSRRVCSFPSTCSERSPSAILPIMEAILRTPPWIDRCM